jgi:hypothetical protein
VRFKRLSREEIESYLASGEWRGKAGGYAIQGFAGTFVVKLVGSYTNVVGLPLYETVALLSGEGYPRAFQLAGWRGAGSKMSGHAGKVTPLRPKRPCPECGKPSAREPIRSARRAARMSTSTAGFPAPMSFPVDRCESRAITPALPVAANAANV